MEVVDLQLHVAAGAVAGSPCTGAAAGLAVTVVEAATVESDFSPFRGEIREDVRDQGRDFNP